MTPQIPTNFNSCSLGLSGCRGMVHMWLDLLINALALACFLGLCSWSSLLKKKYIWKDITKNWPRLCLEIYLRSTRYKAALKCFWWTIEVNYTQNESLPLNISLVRFFIWFLREVCHSGGWLCVIKSLICQKKKFWFFILGMALSNRPLYQKHQMPANNILTFLSTRHTTFIYTSMEKQKTFCSKVVF